MKSIASSISDIASNRFFPLSNVIQVLPSNFLATIISAAEAKSQTLLIVCFSPNLECLRIQSYCAVYCFKFPFGKYPRTIRLSKGDVCSNKFTDLTYLPCINNGYFLPNWELICSIASLYFLWNPDSLFDFKNFLKVSSFSNLIKLNWMERHKNHREGHIEPDPGHSQTTQLQNYSTRNYRTLQL